MPEPLTYSVVETAGIIGISRGSAYELIRRGELPAIRIGKRLLITKAAVRELLGLGREEGAPPSIPEKDEPEELTYIVTIRRVTK